VGERVRIRSLVRIQPGEHFGKLSASTDFLNEQSLVCLYASLRPENLLCRYYPRFIKENEGTCGEDVVFTKKFSELKLVYCERYQTKFNAAKREKQLKGWGRAKKQKLIKGELGVNTCTELAEALLAREN